MLESKILRLPRWISLVDAEWKQRSPEPGCAPCSRVLVAGAAPRAAQRTAGAVVTAASQFSSRPATHRRVQGDEKQHGTTRRHVEIF